jgi:acyl-CoA thioesterase
MAADLAHDTRVERISAGSYAATLPEHWNFRTPSGGVLMTVALRAAGVELDAPELQLTSASTIFCEPILAGSLVARVEVMRRGGAAAQVMTSLRNERQQRDALRVVATFARKTPGPKFVDVSPPAVPTPEQAAPFSDPVPFLKKYRAKFSDNFESRLAAGHDWFSEGFRAGDARFARWFRYKVRQHSADGLLDPLALPPIADTMPPAVIMKLGPGFEPFVAPSLDLTMHFLAPTDREWLLVSTQCRSAGRGVATADSEIWDDAGRMLAYATQMMIFRRPPLKQRR